MSFKLTYASMFNPPADMHGRFEEALADVKANLGATYDLHIDGKDVPAQAHDTRKSPIDQRLVTGLFPLATAVERIQRQLEVMAQGGMPLMAFT